MRNKVLDAAKAIAAYSVVLLHVPFPGKTGEVVNALARFAVPFFFMVSGYFCFKAREEDILKKMPGKATHILVLTGVSYLFYLLWGCVQNATEGKNVVDWLGKIITPSNIENFLRYNSSSAVKSHLWFLPALLYCYLIFWVIVKCRACKAAYLLIPVLLTGHIWMDEGRFLFGNACRVMEFRNYLFTGIPFFLMGHLIHREQEILKKKISGFLCFFFVIWGAVMTTAEFFLIGKMEMYIGSVFLSVGIFLFSVLCQELSVPDFLEEAGEKYALFIYVLHPAVKEILQGAAAVSGIEMLPVYLWTKPVIVCILTTAAAAGLHRMFTSIRKFS